MGKRGKQTGARRQPNFIDLASSHVLSPWLISYYYLLWRGGGGWGWGRLLFYILEVLRGEPNRNLFASWNSSNTITVFNFCPYSSLLVTFLEGRWQISFIYISSVLLSGINLSRNSLLVKNHNPVRLLIVSLAWADTIFFFFSILLLLLLFGNQRNILLNLQSMANKNTRCFPQNVSVFLEVCLKSATSYSLFDNTVNLAEIVKPFLNSSSYAPWLTPANCCSWKVVSITNTHTHWPAVRF